MVQFVFFFNPAQDANRIGDSRLLNQKRLETAGQCGILFHVLAVFVQRGGANAMQLTTGQCRLNQVGGIHRTFRRTSTNKSMHFVNKQNDFASGILNFLEHRFQAFLKFTAIFRASDQGTHIKRHQLFVLQAFGDVAIHNAQRQTFGNRGLTDTGFTDQHRVILSPARQHLHRAANFFVATNDRVDLTLLGGLRQIACIFGQGVITIFGTCAISRAPLADIIDRSV